LPDAIASPELPLLELIVDIGRQPERIQTLTFKLIK
jgi:hypothetical protein